MDKIEQLLSDAILEMQDVELMEIELIDGLDEDAYLCGDELVDDPMKMLLFNPT